MKSSELVLRFILNNIKTACPSFIQQQITICVTHVHCSMIPYYLKSLLYFPIIIIIFNKCNSFKKTVENYDILIRLNINI